MMLKVSAEALYEWGKLALVGSSLAIGGYTVVDKVVSRVKAVPILEIRVGRLERKTSYLVKGMEKLTGTKYKRDADED